MNKLTKIGISALCGSLAGSLAAHAGELSVTGGADITWVSMDQEVTGNPLGIGSNLTFSGSGELDNGWSVALTVAHTNANAYSNTNVVIGIPGIGDVRVDQGTTGTGLDRIDDKTPIVWEEAWGTALGTGIDLVDGVASSANIEWTPSMTPDGLTAHIAYTPDGGGGASTADKGSAGTDSTDMESGWDIVLVASSDLLGVDGLSVGAGMSSINQDASATGTDGDREERTVYATYASGGFTIGYQWSTEDNGNASGATEYNNDAYGITFNVNDDLSVGYNHYESEQTNSTNVTAEVDTIQIAYSMGGATITLAEAQGDNLKYQTAASGDRDATTIKLALAF